MAFVLDMVGLTVKSLEDSIRFYRILGLEIPDPEPGSPYAEVRMANGLRLSFNQIEMVKELDPEWVQPVGQGIGIAFLCDSPEDVDKRYERLIDAGYRSRREPWDAFWGQRYALVYDPDGTSVDLFAYLPTS